MIKLTIDQTQKQYRNDDKVNPSLLWEMIKMKVPEKSVSYAIGKKRQAANMESVLEEKKLLLEKESAWSTVGSEYSNTLTEELDLCKRN